MEDSIIIRAMSEDDYDGLLKLWHSIEGMAIRSIDDSRADVIRFIKRNPTTSVVAVDESTGRIVGSILCGNDGRQGSFYHVCVSRDYRRRGIGTKMVVCCMNALKDLEINKITLIAFTSNSGGNAFWKKIGWTHREDCNYYEFVLNEDNITRFVEAEIDDA